MSIQSIKATYQGYDFHSRLAARWAIFFDALGFPWEYREEGYDFDGVWYRPDFYLPEQDCWVEITGAEPNEEEEQKAELLAYFTERPVCTLWGPCQPPRRDSRFPLRYKEQMHWNEKCSATFYGTFIPFPFKDQTPYESRMQVERGILDERNRINSEQEYHVEDVPLPVAGLLKPYAHAMEIALKKGKIEVFDVFAQAMDEYKEDPPIFSELKDKYHHENYLREDISSQLEKYKEVLQFLSIKEGWRCVFSDGCYRIVGWGECSHCGRIDLNASLSVCEECHTQFKKSPYPTKIYDSPRLLAAYTAARQARFERIPDMRNGLSAKDGSREEEPEWSINP